MKPEIHYARTSDGVNIAYGTAGGGAPLIMLPAIPVSHFQEEWAYAQIGRWYDRIAVSHLFTRYDCRGAGLSDRNVSDHSIEAHLRDLDAVVAESGPDPVALFALGDAGMVAIAYAAKRPERVSNLILFCTYLRSVDAGSAQGATFDAIVALIDKDWETFTETWTHFRMGWSATTDAHRFSALVRAAIEPEHLKRVIPYVAEFDASRSASGVKAPTLIIHRKELPGWNSIDRARDLAAAIAGATLVLIDGRIPLPMFDEGDDVLSLIEGFLHNGSISAGRWNQSDSTTAIILFADIVDSTALTERIGDAAFHRQSDALQRGVREALALAGGHVVDGRVLGDGVMAVFDAAKDAIAAAGSCHAAAEAAQLQLHVGIHAGDVIRNANDVYGGAVNIAARIAAASAPGETLVSDVVRALGRTSAGVAFDDRGEHALKGITDPHRLFAVRRP